MTPLDFIHDTTFDNLPSAAIHEAVRCFVDTLGVAVGGSETKLSQIIHAHAVRQFGGSSSTLWQDGRKVSAAGAALANGMTIDSLDAHDGHKLTKGHVGCGVLPGLIAVMEAEGVNDPRELLTSIVIGYEIGTRAGIALHSSACDYHTSGAWIALATAALTSRQLGLTKTQTREAIGIAEYHGPRSQMMRCIDAPTMVKDGSGWGAMAGVSAGYLAQDDFTGAPAITLEDPALNRFWSDLGQNWYIEQQYIKLYPVCRWAQPAAEGAIALVREHGINTDQIVKIKVESFHEAKRLKVIPTNTEQAQYSLPFSVAVALIYGTISVAHITKNGLTDKDVLNLSKLVEISETDEFNSAFPAQRFARVHLVLKSGKVLSSEKTEAQGDPENKISDTLIWDKFRTFTIPILGDEWANSFLENAQNLPKMSNVSILFKQLATKGLT
ncbi:MAG: MmgE/PrpD family protein [Rhodobacteraceae bacterium]|nr:MmgE/PrpD family protein [Paracoccaceae bacterium]